jgi:DNA polymerase-3 subunit delta
MQVRADALDALLKDEIKPVYLVSGDEPLQVQESVQKIKQAARQAGYTDTLLLIQESSFDWDQLQREAISQSLFGGRRLIELRLRSARPGQDGAKALAEFCARPRPALLLLKAPRLDKTQLRSKWVQAIDRIGVVLQVWPIDYRQLPAWLGARARRLGLELDAAAAQLLAEHVEGNMLAAAQELEKLLLLHGAGKLGEEQVMAAISSSNRYDVFGLTEAMAQNHGARVQQILLGLRGEGVAASVVLWALARELRLLVQLARYPRGLPKAVQQNFRLPAQRLRALQQAAGRQGMEFWLRALMQCSEVDARIKGQAKGCPWRAMSRLLGEICTQSKRTLAR